MVVAPMSLFTKPFRWTVAWRWPPTVISPVVPAVFETI